MNMDTVEILVLLLPLSLIVGAFVIGFIALWQICWDT